MSRRLTTLADQLCGALLSSSMRENEPDLSLARRLVGELMSSPVDHGLDREATVFCVAVLHCLRGVVEPRNAAVERNHAVGVLHALRGRSPAAEVVAASPVVIRVLGAIRESTLNAVLTKQLAQTARAADAEWLRELITGRRGFSPFGSLEETHPATAVGAIPLGADSRIAVDDTVAEQSLKAYYRSADIGDLRRAVEVYRAVAAELGASRADNVPVYNNLGLALRELGTLTGDLGLLQEAVDHLERGRAATDDPGQLCDLDSNLAMTFLKIYEATSDVNDLDRCLAVAEAASRGPQNSRGRTLGLTTSAQALLHRFQRTGDVSALEQAVTRGADAVSDAQDDSVSRGVARTVHGTTLQRHYEALGDIASLHGAVDVLRAALGDVPEMSPMRAPALLNAANAVVKLHERDGDVAVLDEGVTLHREAMALLRSAGSHELPRSQANLAFALLMRSRFGGRSDDLIECIDLLTGAVDADSINHVERVQWMGNLATALISRYAADHDSTDARRAIIYLRKAIDLAGVGFWNVISLRSQLAAVLLQQGLIDGNWTGLDESVQLYREVVEATEQTHPYRATRLIALSHALMTLAERRARDAGIIETTSTLVEAVSALDEAEHYLPQGNPGRSLCFLLRGQLAGLEYRTFRRIREMVGDEEPSRGEDQARARALRAYTVAAGSDTDPALSRIASALGWAEFAVSAGATDDAVRAYRLAVGLLDGIAWRGLERHDQERMLAHFLGVASDAASVVASAGQPELAVELLEQGRAVLLSQTLENRTSLDSVAEVNPDLARRLSEVYARLESDELVGDPLTPGLPQPSYMQRADDRIALARRRDRLIAEIRELPGLAAFLQPTPYLELRVAAARGPVVIVNVSRHGSQAFVLYFAEGIDVVDLPSVSPEVVKEKVDVFTAALSSGRTSPETQAATYRVLTWLGENVVAPIAATLKWRAVTGEVTDRVWLCQTGLLSFLPLHAAIWTDPTDGCVRSTADYCVPSYTPTVRALLRRPSRPNQDNSRSRVVVSVLDEDPARRYAAELEVDVITGRLPGVWVLQGAQAGRDAVVAALGTAEIVHFACHAVQDLHSPVLSHLVLYDGTLPIVELGRARRSNGGLAVLSACGTARGDRNLPDESVTMTIALQLAGFEHVVGTLWAIGDRTALEMADVFYGVIAEDGTVRVDRAARALHRAVQEIRRRHPDTPTAWSCFVHVGP